MMGVPRLLFHSPDKDTFEIDGHKLSASAISRMTCDVFKRAESLLQNDILRGLTDEELGVNLDTSTIQDELVNDKVGYGFLRNSSFNQGMYVMRAFMQHPKLKGSLHYMNGGKPRFKAGASAKLLDKIAVFKELLYVLIHFAAGMPKRGASERRLKAANIPKRLRNLLYTLGRLALVGNHDKTISITEADKATLHFIPPCITRLILRYFACIAFIEYHLVEEFECETTPDFDSYLFSCHGKVWPKNRPNVILAREMKRYFNLPIVMSEIRHILNGIAEHFSVEVNHEVRTSIRHSQAGRSHSLGERLYSRTRNALPMFTNQFVHDTMEFSDIWHTLMGFGSDPPIPMSAEQMYSFSTCSATSEKESELAKAIRDLTLRLSAIGPQGPTMASLQQTTHMQVIERQLVHSIFHCCQLFTNRETDYPHLWMQRFHPQVLHQLVTMQMTTLAIPFPFSMTLRNKTETSR
jgi:hypothetical protein